ncbi:MAG: restriction endonuclease, partial [Luteibacter sp.]
MFAARQTPATGGDALARLTWQDFEHLLAEHYRDQGYLVEHHAPAASLKAIGTALDLRLHRGSEIVIVQCKHWDADEVQVQDINELLGNMLNAAATKGVFVTRGRYSAEARALMRRQPRLQLVDGDVLRVMLKLPDHLDISLPASAGGRPGKAAKTSKADKAAGKPRRRGASGLSSTLGPALLVLGIAVLLG